MYKHRNKIEETTLANIDLFYFSSFIFKKITKKQYFRKKIQLRKNQVVLTQMTLETQRIHLDFCLSMRNVGISQQSMIVENLLEILTNTGNASSSSFLISLNNSQEKDPQSFLKDLRINNTNCLIIGQLNIILVGKNLSNYLP